MSVRIEIVEGYPDASLVTGICRISEYPLALFERQIKHQHRILVCCAYVGDELVGYKLGSGTLLDRGTHHNVLLQKQLNES